ncbi:MAG: DNA polymerase [bacterium]
MDRENITHYHNQRPVYRKDDKDIFEWDNPKEVMGNVNKPNYYNYHPFIIDIETSAELGQQPILLVGYDSLEKTLLILYAVGYQGYKLDKKKAKELIPDIEYSRLIIDNFSKTKFEKYVIKKIHNWNTKAEERYDRNRKSLVAHNAKFDIPMIGTPNDEILDIPTISNQFEQCCRYSNINMLGHRAGAFGQIYSFVDIDNDFEFLDIPVGDTMVASKSMWIEPANLKSACESMNVDLEVSESETHGVLNDEYVEYCINDVIATYKLYNKLQGRLNNMFGNLPIEHIYSTASIGKYVLRKMNYKRVGYTQNAVDKIVPAYFGGRTDANITGKIVDNLRYTDILSEYPTVSKLTNIWDYMKVETIDVKRISENELPKVDFEDLKDPKTWSEISDYYVKIRPNGATLPVRTRNFDETTKVVTANVKSDKDMVYHYMDIVSSKLIDKENNIDIKACWKVTKSGKQNIESAEIAGVRIDPEDNVMAKSIESRKEIQKKEGKNSKTKSLKIVANSLYGISAERIVEEINDEKQDVATENGFYNPHVATTITAGGRLMLAFGEYVANKNGGKLVYCDTDSLIIPDKVTKPVIEAYNNLNPYDGYAGELDVLEDEKGEIGKLYAVGPKKYVFFNENKVLEYKEHGLGNYENLRDKKTIKQLWATILKYDLGKNPLPIKQLYEYELEEKVIWSFNASTRSMRVLIDKLTEDYIRYGEWVESTISYDDKTRYIALDLKDKEDNDYITKVETVEEKPTKIEQIKKKDIDENKIKTVRDIIMKFVNDSKGKNEIPKVYVENMDIVTKEATNRKDIFVTRLQEQFKKNMKTAIEHLNL